MQSNRTSIRTREEVRTMDMLNMLGGSGLIFGAILLAWLGFPVVRRQVSFEAKAATALVLLLCVGLNLGLAYIFIITALK